MDGYVKTKLEGDILIVTGIGEFDKQLYLECREEVISQLKESNSQYTLFDIRKAIIIASTTDIFQIASTTPGSFPPRTKYAIVYSPITFPKSAASFAQTVALNRGANTQLFTDIIEAKNWLTKIPPNNRV